MAAFSPLLDVLAEVPDPRRAEGKLYSLPHLLLFAILAIVAGCNSYRGIVTFIAVHRRRLNAVFDLTWRRAPAHTAIRYILQGLDPAEVEAAFRPDAARVDLHPGLIKSGRGAQGVPDVDRLPVHYARFDTGLAFRAQEAADRRLLGSETGAVASDLYACRSELNPEESLAR